MQNLLLNTHVAILNNYYLYNDLSSGLNKIFNSGRTAVMGVALAGAALAIAIGGILYQTGSAENISKGKKHMIAAIIGMVIVFGAYAIASYFKNNTAF